MRFVDLAGLSRHISPEYLEALDLGDATPIAPEHRLTMLKRLREGAGVHVVTGPEGAAFWAPVSVEVHVDVVPDGYSVTERAEPDMVWALRASGLSQTVSAGAVRHYGEDKAPSARSSLYARWQAAQSLLAAFNEETTPYGAIVVEAHAIEAVVDRDAQLRLLDKVENCSLDWEWNIDPAAGPMFEPEGLSVATADRTWYFPFWAQDLLPEFGYEDTVRAAVERVVMRTPTVWHHAKADLGTQWRGAPLEAYGSQLHDTLVMAFIAGEFDLALKSLARSRLHRDPLDFPGAMRNLSLETCRRYGGADARNTFDLFHSLAVTLQERQQWDVYDKIERPIIPLLTDMERWGQPVDMAEAQRLRDAFAAECEAIRQRFLASDGLDLEKDADTRELIKRRIGYDPGSLRKEAIAKIEGEWMDAVLRFRQARHQKRAFLDKHIAKWEAAGRPDDFRLFTSYTQAGDVDQYETRGFRHAPRSGRLSSRKMDHIPTWIGNAGASGENMQNQPTSILSIFTAPPGYTYWAKDASQLELRIGAAMSGDRAMMEDLATGDMHAATRDRLLPVLAGMDVPRTVVKQFNFCLAPETRVLLSDLTWKPIEDVVVGDELIAPDEESVDRPKHRRLRRSTVLSRSAQTLDGYEIEFSNGATVRSSAEHLWLAHRDSNPPYKWWRTDALRVGDRVPWLCAPWERDTTAAGGWLAGILDGEGSWRSLGRSGLSIAQKHGPVLDEIVQVLAEKGYHYALREEDGTHSVCRVELNKREDVLRFLGSTRPVRFISNAARAWEGARNGTYKTVVRVTPIGHIETVGLQTSTRTLIAEGFWSHNSGAYGGHADVARTILNKQRIFVPDDLLVQIAEARREIYARYHQAGDEIVEFAKLTGYAETAFGRRRYDPDIHSRDQKTALHARRALINHRLGQGTAADMVKIAMNLAVPVLKHFDAHLAHQKHDELAGWVRPEQGDAFLAALDAALAPVTLPGVTFEWSGGLGRTWADAKGH